MNAIRDFFKRDARATFFTLTLGITLLFFAPWHYADSAGISGASAVQRDDPPGKTKPLHAKGAALDVHTHVASPALTNLFLGDGVTPVGADDLVAKLDEAHVKRAIILSGAYFALPDDSNVAPENDYVASEIAKFPDRLIGFCGINPLFDSALAEIDRCLALPGMVGIKLHLEGSGVDLTDDSHVEKLNAVFDRIAALDAPVMMHVAEANELPLSARSFGNLTAILDAHPTVRVAFAHCAGHTDDDTIELWLRLHHSGYNPETSFVDISACLAFHADAPLAQRELMVWRFRKWGIDHVLFGSDYFAFFGETPQETLDILTKYPFTQQELDTILNNDGAAWLGQ
ncbi:MAG: amidohydrolase family protein [Caldilineaceae bacterium]